MNNKIREIQNKYIPFVEEYKWLDSYADEIWKEAQKELLEDIETFRISYYNYFDNTICKKIDELLKQEKLIK